MGKERHVVAGVLVGFFALVRAPTVSASLAPGEAEQVRHEVSTATNVGRVRALVARPDLTSAEAAAAMASAMSMTPVDAPHAAFLHDLVFGAASAASRPMLAVAVVRGLLARADTLIAQHPGTLAAHPSALAEMERAYALVEDVVSAPATENMTDSARADCAAALREHFARNASILRPDTVVAPSVASLRAQAAIALIDALPDTPGRRVDAADALQLSGARRASLVELGVLLLDAGGGDARVAAVRSMLDRFPAAAEGIEAVVIGDERAGRLRARGGAVVGVNAPAPGPLDERASPWGSEAAPPDVDAVAMAVARSIGAAAVQRALDKRPQLRGAIDHDGGEAAVATAAAMLAVDAPRTFDVAVARLLSGKRETAAALSDAVGALAALAPQPKKGSAPSDGVSVSFGRPGEGAVSTLRATRVSLDARGAASALRLDGHTWRWQRDDGGQLVNLFRDSASVSAKSLATARPTPSEGTSWTGGGLVFARLAGSPRAVVTAGPHVWVYGSSVTDAVATPAPGDDVVVEADLRADGGPAGIVVRALPGSVGAIGPFKGVSLMIVPGPTAHAALLVADGWGTETATAPPVPLSSARQHVRVTVKGTHIEAKIGGASLEATLPGGFEHGDIALRAYGGASLEATGWKVRKL